jgi:hypothetical protein
MELNSYGAGDVCSCVLALFADGRDVCEKQPRAELFGALS